MAIFHESFQIIGRSSGSSSVAAAAYRAGQSLEDQRTGIKHDYTKKTGIVHAEIILPKGASQSFKMREVLWNAVEQSEKRKDSQLAREINISLPRELSRTEQIELIRDYVTSQFVNIGMCADITVHDNGNGNPHAHVMLTMRGINENGEFGLKETKWNNRDNIELWREAWAIAVNSVLERQNFDDRIDHRSFERQGKQEVPSIYIGHVAYKLEKRGVETAGGNENRRRAALNMQIRKLDEEEKNLLKEKTSIEVDLIVATLAMAKYSSMEAQATYYDLLDDMKSKKRAQASIVIKLEQGQEDIKQGYRALQSCEEHIRILSEKYQQVWTVDIYQRRKVKQELSSMKEQLNRELERVKALGVDISIPDCFRIAHEGLQQKIYTAQIELQQEEQRVEAYRQQMQSKKKQMLDYLEQLAQKDDDIQIDVHLKIKQVETPKEQEALMDNPILSPVVMRSRAIYTLGVLHNFFLNIKRAFEEAIPERIRELIVPRDKEKTNQRDFFMER